MNLFWLKYVSWALLAGASFFYFTLRLNKLLLARGALVALYASCIVLACVTWYVQESNAQQHSPRQLLVGTVASVSAHRHKSGSIEDEFALTLPSGATSQQFSTDAVAGSAAQQPLHPGDTVGVLYRTWDDVPLTIDELEGQQPGWHYTRTNTGMAYIFAISVGGFVGLLGALSASRRQANTAAPDPETSLHLND